MSSYPNTLLNDQSLLFQQTTNFYTLSNASFVFEFIPMNVSVNYNTIPYFQPYTEASGSLGFNNVSATSWINASANNFSTLFKFQSNDITFTDYPNQNISYGIDNASTVFNISFSQSLIYAGWANSATQFQNNTSLDQDYVRYMANAITGGYALSDIFANENELLKGVDSLDLSFNYSLNNNIKTYYANSTTFGMGTFPNASNDPYVVACKQLLDGLLSNASTDRGKVFLSDLALQSSLQGPQTNEVYYIWFHPGDVLSVRLNYIPKNGNGLPAGSSNNYLGSNPLYTRPYKVFIQFV
jgi:hypothetical protein